MLSRRHLRIKALQSLYVFFRTGNDRIDVGEKQLLQGIDHVYDLLIHQLAFGVEVVSYARQRIEEGKSKFLPTREDLNPNTRFVDNKFIQQLSHNADFKKQCERLHINWWQTDEELVRKFFNQFRYTNEFKKYMELERSNYKIDRDLIKVMINKYMFDFEPLRDFYGEQNIYWIDDFYIVDAILGKFIATMKETSDTFESLPGIYKDSIVDGVNEDRKFVRELFRKTIIHSDTFEKVIEERATNWEFDRIAIMDILLLKMAFTEINEMNSIPVKVTLNEYIEISKAFSSPKSKIFINGILDKYVDDLKAENRLLKTGRGLIE